jgi:hypothetical protein
LKGCELQVERRSAGKKLADDVFDGDFLDVNVMHGEFVE